VVTGSGAISGTPTMAATRTAAIAGVGHITVTGSSALLYPVVRRPGAVIRRHRPDARIT
jgi:hypothetical protein